MKTLDELIAYFDNQTQQRHVYLTEDAEDIYNDALHYLKEYRNTDENYKKAIAHVTEVIDHYEKMVADYLAVNNPPLTWDELKQMEGKPVWVESKRYGDHWYLLENVSDDSLDCIGIYEERVSYDRDDDDWQAYRKERK